jgi:hypothetical protein
LGSLAYTLIPKEKRIRKLAEKANKGILVGFESFNNYLIYIPSLNKIINTKDILIKEDLNYKDEYIIKEDYSNIVPLDSLKLLSSLELPNSLKLPNIREDNSELKGDIRELSNSEQELDELNSEYYNTSPIKRSKRLKGEPASASQVLSLYKLASQAYYTTREEVKDIKDTKIIVPNNPNIIEPNNYIKANNSKYKEYWKKAEEKELESLINNNI